MTIHPTARIHASAVVEPGAVIGEGCEVGPFCLIGAEVTLHARVTVKSHAVLTGWTEVGEDSVIFPFATVGEVPQDLKYVGEHTRLIIGKRVRIREGATLNPGTEGGGGVTRVGDDVLIMTGAHVGHDAQIGDRVILVNHVAIAGHCVLGDDVIVGGLSGVHQWVRIGQGAIIGAVTMVTNDVIPYGLVQAPRGELDGLNLVGLKRRGVDRAEITALRAAYQTLAQEEGSFLDRARKLAEESDSPLVREIADFILSKSDRSFLTPKGGR
ncbi:acyl-ACP--UDP-N-acetylglucosamine O-acyltransferase [Tabrizicola sp.]|uniref:acyl-ACP--UDP-N-acetylglucosamine O-acyltransferase n=1 Tax=Tabrizicola sp. TaxID=2005166 RepID=UPI0026039044|nr:acyl-ACP--UDP-N-acetylglucosamine O-acyltransferase [Tabrizicola sp.]MDM7930802.1 acyl-ACP--UDP-N-acetylglucosamine O-acyltransferase [Tabrizicola sp.]